MQNEERINVLEGKVKKLEELVHTLRTTLPSSIIRAQCFIVEDKEGNELVQLDADTEENGCVSTFNKEGERVAILGADTEGNGDVSTHNKKGECVAILGADNKNKRHVVPNCIKWW